MTKRAETITINVLSWLFAVSISLWSMWMLSAPGWAMFLSFQAAGAGVMLARMDDRLKKL